MSQRGSLGEQESSIESYLGNLLSATYALVLTIVSFIFEVSPTWQKELWLVEFLFFMGMYGIGLGYLILCYVYFMEYHLIFNGKSGAMEHVTKREPAGTLYLRIGAQCFAVAGIVLFVFEIILWAKSNQIRKSNMGKHAIVIIFTLLQSHFVFFNARIAFYKWKILSKFGLMHLVAVNLWGWFRFVLAEEVNHTEHEDPQALADWDDPPDDELGDGDLAFQYDISMELLTFHNFGDMATFLVTCYVEFSLISAVIMYMLWSSVDSSPTKNVLPSIPKEPKCGGWRKVDFRNSLSGAIWGVLFLLFSVIALITCTIVSGGLDSSAPGALPIFGAVDITSYVITLLVVIVGIWKMRLLQYRTTPHGEVIDEILLYIGLTGELIMCIVGTDAFIGSRGHPEYHPAIGIALFSIRFCQVVSQTVLILIVSRLRCRSSHAREAKPGKEIITFLIIANMTFFLFQNYEQMQAPFNFTGIRKTLLKAVGPMLVFYRFHSSACFAESWSHTYHLEEEIQEEERESNEELQGNSTISLSASLGESVEGTEASV